MPLRNLFGKQKKSSGLVFFDSFLRREIRIGDPKNTSDLDADQTPTTKTKSTKTQDKTLAVKDKQTGLKKHKSPKSKIVSQSTDTEVQTDSKPDFLQSVLGVFWSDVVWYSVAAASLLAVVLFYFQGLQPNIVYRYRSEVIQQIRSVQQEYQTQVQGFLQAQEAMRNNFQLSLTVTCDQQQAYTKQIEDSSNLERLRVAMLAKPELRQIPTVWGFYISEMEQAYDSFFSKYKESADFLESSVADLQTVPLYLAYVDAWRQACVDIRQSNGNLSNLKQVCQNLRRAVSDYESKRPPFFREQIQNRFTTAIALCQPVEAQTQGTILSGYNQWQLEWIGEYGNIITYTPSFGEILERLESQSQGLLQELERTSKRIDDAYAARQGFANLWYLLERK